MIDYEQSIFCLKICGEKVAEHASHARVSCLATSSPHQISSKRETASSLPLWKFQFRIHKQIMAFLYLIILFLFYLFCHTEKNTVNSDKIFINSFE